MHSPWRLNQPWQISSSSSLDANTERRAAAYVRQRLARLGARGGAGKRGVERRFYYRLYDVNGTGWRAARRLAEPYRDALRGIVDPTLLNAYLPPPDHDLTVRNGITDASGPKMLVGLMLWARDHLH